MLILTRKIGQVITIGLHDHIDTDTPVSGLDWPLKILVKKVNGEQVKIGIHADPRFLVQREEALPRASARARAIEDTKNAIESLDAALNALRHAKRFITGGEWDEFVTQIQQARRAIWAAESTGIFDRQNQSF